MKIVIAILLGILIVGVGACLRLLQILILRVMKLEIAVVTGTHPDAQQDG